MHMVTLLLSPPVYVCCMSTKRTIIKYEIFIFNNMHNYMVTLLLSPPVCVLYEHKESNYDAWYSGNVDVVGNNPEHVKLSSVK